MRVYARDGCAASSCTRLVPPLHIDPHRGPHRCQVPGRGQAAGPGGADGLADDCPGPQRRVAGVPGPAPRDRRFGPGVAWPGVPGPASRDGLASNAPPGRGVVARWQVLGGPSHGTCHPGPRPGRWPGRGRNTAGQCMDPAGCPAGRSTARAVMRSMQGRQVSRRAGRRADRQTSWRTSRRGADVLMPRTCLDGNTWARLADGRTGPGRRHFRL